MAWSGGDPGVLDAEAQVLSGVADRLTEEALRLVGLGREIGGLSGDGAVDAAASRACSAVGGVVNAGAHLAAALSDADITQADQLVTATGGPR